MGNLFMSYEGPEPYIFISYARKDKELVYQFLKALHEKGYRLWWDEGGIPWGNAWRETIESHIDRAAVCLLFWSAASVASRHCQAETEEMVSESKAIIQVFLDNTSVETLPRGLRMYLRKFQSVKLAAFSSNAAFVERLDQETAFARCKSVPRPTVQRSEDGEIQWSLDGDGTLTIAKNAALRDCRTAPMPYHSLDSAERSTAPWMEYRERICAAVIGRDISEISWNAFRDCPYLTNVTISGSVTTIGGFAFMDCPTLTGITLPNSVNAIGEDAFNGCSGLKSVTIPEGVTIIGEGAFLGCSGLKDVTIPDSTDIIGAWAFDGCSGLTGVTLGRGVTKIGEWAFKGCEGLTNITIPDSVTEIGVCAFYGCTNLLRVEISEEVRYEESGEYASFPSHTRIVRRAPYRE